jgi:hypothetical protein
VISEKIEKMKKILDFEKKTFSEEINISFSFIFW